MAAPLHITAPLAALTTVFTPPCSTSWLVATTRLPSQFPSFPGPGPATCDPPAWSANLAGKGFQFYSPAICPDGFSVGAGCFIESKTRTAEGFPAVTDGETAAWCVPSGHTCTSDTTDFRGGIWGVSRTDTAASGTVTVTVGPALQIRWRDADLLYLATHPLTPGLTLATPTPAPAPTPAPTPAPSPMPTPNTPPVSTTSPTVAPIPLLNGGSQATADSSSDDSGSKATMQTERTSSKSQTATTAPTRSVPLLIKPNAVATVSTSGSGSGRHSTVVSPATMASPGGDSNSSSSSSSSVSTSTAVAATAAAAHETKGAAAPYVHRLVIALVVVSLVGVVASGLAVFFFSMRRRQRRWQQPPQHQHQHNGTPSATRDLEDQQGSQRPCDGSAPDSGPGSGFTAIGTGAWIRTKQSRVAWLRSRVAPVAMRWRGRLQWQAPSWPISVFGGGRSVRDSAVSDPELESWRRRRRQRQSQTTPQRMGTPARQPARDGNEDEEKHIRQREEALGTAACVINDDEDDDDKALGVGTAEDRRRLSMLERLSHFLRAPSGDGGGMISSGSRSSSRSGTDGAETEAHLRGGGADTRSLYTATSASRLSTTRWSRWSRWTLRSTDDGLDEGAGVVVHTAVEQPIPPLPPPQQLRLLLLPTPPPPSSAAVAGCRRGPRGHGRGLSVPPRRGEGGGGGGGAGLGAGGGADDGFARLSNGTFGLLASPARELPTRLSSRSESRSSGQSSAV